MSLLLSQPVIKHVLFLVSVNFSLFHSEKGLSPNKTLSGQDIAKYTCCFYMNTIFSLNAAVGQTIPFIPKCSLILKTRERWQVRPFRSSVTNARWHVLVLGQFRKKWRCSEESLLILLSVHHSFLKLLLNSPPPGSSDEVSLEQESEDDIHSSRSSLDRQSHHRANTTMHVCWYRNTSVSMTDHSVAVEVPHRAQLSPLTLSVSAHSVPGLPPVHVSCCLQSFLCHESERLKSQITFVCLLVVHECLCTHTHVLLFPPVQGSVFKECVKGNLGQNSSLVFSATLRGN